MRVISFAGGGTAEKQRVAVGNTLLRIKRL